MTDVREATDDLLAEKPGLEADLRDVLAVDDRADGWTFDEVPLDSGTFGELVARDIVAKDDGEYEVADPAAVRASLNGDEESVAGSGFEFDLPSLSLPSISRVEAGALGGALAFVLLMRTYIYPSVFRGEYVVLPSNDPYLYRYWVERLAVESTGVFDLSVLSEVEGGAAGEPLLLATLWWVTNLLGGADASGIVLAWYPVVSALIVAVLVYSIAVRITHDRRVGLASIAFLAVIPAFAYRTGLGFADHHAFDYPWLALTALALVWLADVEHEDLEAPGTWLAAGALGVAVAGQVLAWEAGPLLIGALGVYVAVRAVADVRGDRSPLVAVAPIAAGLVLASILAHLAHAGFGWQRDVVVYSPALLLIGITGVVLVGEAIRRAGMPGYALAAAEVAGALCGLALVFVFLPSFAEVLSARLDFLLFRTGIAENKSIFAGGPSGFFLGPILELGFAWVLAVPMLAMASLRTYRHDRRLWLVLCTYGWYFLVLASLQRRFVGELAPFFAVLAGYAFVVLAAKLDVTAFPAFSRDEENRGRQRNETSTTRSFSLPDRSTITALAILFLFVSSAGAVQTGVRHEQVKISDENFRAASWIDERAEEQGLEYPENYVLSKWGRNRMYNYFVNGESESYDFAENNYESFLSSRDPESEYHRLKDRVGFVVTKDLNQNAPANFTYARLHHRFGSAGSDGAPGVGHYRAVYASDDGSVKVFRLVPGATITGEAQPNATLTASTKVEIEGGSFTYERRVSTNRFGTYELTVSHPGTYQIGEQTVEVPESAVSSGERVNTLGDSGAYWPFDVNADDTAYDIRSGNNMDASSAEWVEGHNGSAVALDRSDSLRADASPSIDGNESVTLSTWFRADEGVDFENDAQYTRIALKGEKVPFSETNGYQIATTHGQLVGLLGDGEDVVRLHGPRVDDGEWHHATLTWNGETVSLYVDGNAVDEAQWSGELNDGHPLTVGQNFPGAIDDLRIYERALSAGEVESLYSGKNDGNDTAE